jgi:hypothetical protein
VIGIGAHALRRFRRSMVRVAACRRGDSGPAIAASDRRGNVDLKCLILSPFLRYWPSLDEAAEGDFDAPRI